MVLSNFFWNVLFLRDIKNNKSLKIEGEEEDIEITTDSGLVYAQAKCLFNINSRSSVLSHYRKALLSLKDNADRATKLIYISNIEDPFNDKEYRYYSFDTEFSFDQLKDKTKKKIKRVLGDSFDYDKLDVIIKHFYGNEENKKKILLEEISRFLIQAIKDDSFKYSIYNGLITDGIINASDKKYSVTKSKFIFNMVIPYLQSTRPDEEQIGIDDDNYQYARELYQYFINDFEYDYSFISLVLSDYKIEKEQTNCSFYQFTISFADKYMDYIPVVYDDSIRSELIRILVYRVLKNKYYLDRIKAAANLK